MKYKIKILPRQEMEYSSEDGAIKAVKGLVEAGFDFEIHMK